jgi:hypothetical protein
MPTSGQTKYPAIPGIPDISLESPLTGFGEVLTSTPQPSSQVAFVYALNPQVVTSYVYGTAASASVVNGEVVLASGTTTTGYARVFSKRVAKYRPGQATNVRWTARFTAGSSGNRQMAGPYNIEGGYQFGYNGTSFGILYTEAATVEVQTLTVTGAPAVGGNVTVTLDGGPGVLVAVTVSGNTSITASEIAAADYSQVAGGWTAQAVANVVYFTRRLPGTAGASTFNAGATGTAATFAILTTGAAATETFIPQASWNKDPFNGSGPSGASIDTTKGNVFAVQFQYLGYGDAFFYIENPLTGRLTLVHVIQNANARTSTNLRNPNLYLTWESRNTGTATSVTLRGASGGAFIEGPILMPLTQFSAVSTATCGAGTETPILTIRASTVYANRLSTVQVQVDRISIACDGTKSVAFKVYKNSTLTAAKWVAVGAASSASYDFSATASTGGTLVYAFSAAKTANVTEALSDLVLSLQPGETLTLTGTSVNASDVTAAFVWIEDL